jgi:hypothetical protein
MTTPTIARVEMTSAPADAVFEEPMITVWTHWAGVDRSATHGYTFRDDPNGRTLAERLTRAILAGVVFINPTVRTDVEGQTYVEARSAVLGRYTNADLRRLGY